jgi:feruloyl esterase
VLSPANSEAAWAFDFPNYMASFDAPTGITYKNIEFTKQEFRKLHELSGIYDPTKPDLSQFAGHGGKLLLWTGAADSGASPAMVENYYAAVRDKMGKDKASEFMTFYLAPGVYHCGGGPTPARADYLTPLMQWTETGANPDRVVVNYLTSPTDSTVSKTRPVYPYPAIAKYIGAGSKDDAANFVKSDPVQRFNDRLNWVGISHYTSSHTKWYVPGEPRLSSRPPR